MPIVSLLTSLVALILTFRVPLAVIFISIAGWQMAMGRGDHHGGIVMALIGIAIFFFAPTIASYLPQGFILLLVR